MVQNTEYFGTAKQKLRLTVRNALRLQRPLNSRLLDFLAVFVEIKITNLISVFGGTCDSVKGNILGRVQIVMTKTVNVYTKQQSILDVRVSAEAEYAI